LDPISNEINHLRVPKVLNLSDQNSHLKNCLTASSLMINIDLVIELKEHQ